MFFFNFYLCRLAFGMALTELVENIIFLEIDFFKGSVNPELLINGEFLTFCFQGRVCLKINKR